MRVWLPPSAPERSERREGLPPSAPEERSERREGLPPSGPPMPTLAIPMEERSEMCEGVPPPSEERTKLSRVVLRCERDARFAKSVAVVPVVRSFETTTFLRTGASFRLQGRKMTGTSRA